jgi:hypothetical protein
MILDSMTARLRKKDASADQPESGEIARPGSRKVEEFATRSAERIAETAIPSPSIHHEP